MPSPVNMANFFWPVGDRINEVPQQFEILSLVMPHHRFSAVKNAESCILAIKKFQGISNLNYFS